MNLKRINSLLLISLISFTSVIVKSDIEFISQKQRPSLIELAFLRQLGPSILDAMTAHGDLQLFDYERIEKVVRNEQDDEYEVTLRVVGYEGPHNPPYKLIRITFRIPAHYKNHVKSYEHKIITIDELKKLSEYTD